MLPAGLTAFLRFLLIQVVLIGVTGTAQARASQEAIPAARTGLAGQAAAVDLQPWRRLARKISPLISARDALLVADPRGRILLSRNADKKLVPASTLKLLTALVAWHHLGPTYRFRTEVYQDTRNNLKIKGYGDPLLLSENLQEIAAQLAERLPAYQDLILDPTYFAQRLVAPGVRMSSFQPYDAPNGAFSVNFNTVCFKRRQGGFVTAEPQTPLIDFALPRIRKSGLTEGRIHLSCQANESTLYAGYLLDHFLKAAGLRSHGQVRLDRVRKPQDRLLYRYDSQFSLDEVIAQLLAYSNNFIANQLLIASGAKAYGPPGTLEKGVRAARSYARNLLGIEDISLAEGSGISRHNRLSAWQMNRILAEFAPRYSLMRRSGNEFYKTGTLKGIRTRAGYLKQADGQLYRFVVMLNSPGKSPMRIMRRLKEMVAKDSG